MALARLRECDMMEAKMMLFEIKKINWQSFGGRVCYLRDQTVLTNVPLQTHVKTVFKSVHGLCQFVKFNPLLI